MKIELCTDKNPAATTQPKDLAGSMMRSANGAMPPYIVGPRPDEVRTLWIGDLQYWMDENYLCTCFDNNVEMTYFEVIRNKQTGQSEGYGYIEFSSRAIAERFLRTYHGTDMPIGGHSYRLDWATCDHVEKSFRQARGSTIFVGNLSADVSNDFLQETFRARYHSVTGAMIVIHPL